MLERAWWLLDGAEAEAADALLEFVAAWRADILLTEFFDTRHEFNPALYVSPAPIGRDEPPTDRQLKVFRLHEAAVKAAG